MSGFLTSKAASARRRLRTYARLARDVLRFRRRPRRELVWVDLVDPLFNKRYTYLFLKFLLIEGFQVAMRYREGLVLRFNELKNTRLLFSEEDFYLLPFDAGRAGRYSISDGRGADKRIHLDWFAPEADGAYRIPMPMHPLMYHTGAWRWEPAESAPRVRSVVFSGNVEGWKYAEPGRMARFGMASRMDQVTRIRASALPVEEGLRDPAEDGRVYLLDKASLGVGIEEWRPFLAGFRFFLALPGQVMPLCHSAVEAMSVGTVPVMHEVYASLFDPPLVHGREVVTYADDPVAALRRTLEMPDEESARLSEGGRAYYHRHLVPEVVVANALSEDVTELRLCGEGDSVRMMGSHRTSVPDGP